MSEPLMLCTDTRRECSRGHTPELLRGVAGSVLLHLSPTSRGYLLLGAGGYQGSENRSRTPTRVGLSAGIGRDISRSESGRVRVSVEARYLYFPDLMVGARGVLPVVLRLSF